MISFRPILYVFGLLLLMLGVAMLLPAAVDAYFANPDAGAFVAGSLATLTVGGLLVLANSSGRIELSVKQAFILTTLAWAGLSAFGALPLLFGVGGISYAAAFFETISGLTTTGSTVLSGLDDMPPGILLWRALLQGMGGIGIIVMALAILPFLRVGGMQLFRTESSERGDKIVPRPGQFAVLLMSLYGALVLGCAAAYWAAGMTPFDAFAHACTTIATGGYSTRDSSFGEFPPAVLVVGVIFMTLSALPFALYLRALRGDAGPLLSSAQVRGLLVFLLIVIFALASWLVWTREVAPADALLHAAFNVVSIVTTTGYASFDYQLWGPMAVLLFFGLTFVGGCSGSTSGSVKIFRFQLLWGLLRRVLHRLTLPHGVFRLRYEGRPVSEDVLESTIAFMFAFLATILALAVALSALGLDFITSVSAAATAVANVGPGLGDIVGPAGNFSTLPDSALWLLSLGMLLGRLELFTVFALLSRSFWRD